MNLESYDKEIYTLLNKELERQCDHLEMIASQNFTYPEVMEVMGSVLTNKYAEGYPNKRYYGGCQYIDIFESKAIEYVCKLFKCNYANYTSSSYCDNKKIRKQMGFMGDAHVNHCWRKYSAVAWHRFK